VVYRIAESDPSDLTILGLMFQSISTPGNQRTRDEITSAGRPGISFKLQAGNFPCPHVLFACCEKGEAVGNIGCQEILVTSGRGFEIYDAHRE
jgi:hypothetical protein